MPFGERLELLQGQRVNLAKPVELTLRVGGPALGRGPLEARRQGRLVADHRHGHLGAVLRQQGVRLYPELLERVLGELLKSQPVLGPGDLGAVCGVHYRVEVGG